MTQRLDFTSLSADAYKGMVAIHAAVDGSGLDKGLIELLRLRISQINGCAYCISMHVTVGRKHGLSEERMHMLAVWREATCYTPAERAALAFAEAITILPGQDVPEAVFAEVSAHFEPRMVSYLLFAAVEMNSWNRLMIAVHAPPKAIA